MKRKNRPAFQSVALYDADDNRISSVFKYRSKRLVEQAAKNPGSDIRPLPCYLQLSLFPVSFWSHRVGGHYISVLSWGAK